MEVGDYKKITQQPFLFGRHKVNFQEMVNMLQITNNIVGIIGGHYHLFCGHYHIRDAILIVFTNL